MLAAVDPEPGNAQRAGDIDSCERAPKVALRCQDSMQTADARKVHISVLKNAPYGSFVRPPASPWARLALAFEVAIWLVRKQRCAELHRPIGGNVLQDDLLRLDAQVVENACRIVDLEFPDASDARPDAADEELRGAAGRHGQTQSGDGRLRQRVRQQSLVAAADAQVAHPNPGGVARVWTAVLPRYNADIGGNEPRRKPGLMELTNGEMPLEVCLQFPGNCVPGKWPPRRDADGYGGCNQQHRREAADSQGARFVLQHSLGHHLRLNGFADQQKDNEPDCQEDEKEDLRDTHGSAGNSSESEQSRDDRDDEEYQRPVQHGTADCKRFATRRATWQR